VLVPGTHPIASVRAGAGVCGGEDGRATISQSGEPELSNGNVGRGGREGKRIDGKGVGREVREEREVAASGRQASLLQCALGLATSLGGGGAGRSKWQEQEQEQEQE
jgi:hypothetical protein